MVTLSLEHAEPRVAGYLCRHMYKLRPGVYVGRLSATRRDALWKHILEEQPDIDAVMCWDDANHQIAFRSAGIPTRQVVMLDGLPMLSYQHEPEPAWKTRYFAKSESELHSAKPLWEHMLETSIFAQIFLLDSAYREILPVLAKMAGIDNRQMLNNIVFLISMHDLGKMHPEFQGKLLQTEAPLETQSFRHEVYSTVLLREWLKENEPNVRTRMKLMMVIRDHHQCKSVSLGDGDYCDAYDTRECVHQDASAMVDWFSEKYPYTPFQVNKADDLVFYTLLSGLMRLSDWSVSSFGQELSASACETEGAYEQSVSKRCLTYLKEGSILPHTFQNSYSYGDLFHALSKSDITLRPIQQTMIRAISEHPAPDLILIEGEMGSGKTETALYAAMNMMNACGKQGIYYALPTGATAEAMLPRLEDMQKTADLFPDVSVRLLTGMSWMLGDSDADTRAVWTEKGPRKLFSEFACGTVDQLMAAGEALKAGDMRFLALSNKILVIDEFHAYDAYMLEILKVVLRWMKALHVPVIILSATMQKKTIRSLCSIYSDDTVEVKSYPQITVCDGGRVSEYGCDACDHKVYPVQMIDESKVLEQCLLSVQTGGNALYIANTVGRALKVYQLLEQAKPNDVSIRLYTASTTPENRERIGAELVYLYGKAGKAEGKRPKKTIVVATQIMEMSVDVDFDTEFLELAPVDAILQRIGRMRRHDDKGTVREQGWKSICYIIRPDRSQAGWALPYLESVLNKTEKVLQEKTSISVADDARYLTDTVYEAANQAPDMQRTELQKRVAAISKTAGIPGDSQYRKNDSLKTLPVTRYATYESKPVLCLTKEQIAELPQADREWCIKMIQTRSIASVPEYRLRGIPYLAPEKAPLYLREYTVIQDNPEYWGPEKVFLGGLSKH